jgi:hypothetical protein
MIYNRISRIALSGGIVLEEVVDLSSDRLLMNEVEFQHTCNGDICVSTNSGISRHASATVYLIEVCRLLNNTISDNQRVLSDTKDSSSICCELLTVPVSLLP